MLWRVLQSNGGLPKEAKVLFCNTGKEEEATLRFVRDCSMHWGVPIHWLEYRDNKDAFAIVGFDSASRNGEPFEALIRKRKYLPNPVTRFCTSELKIRTMHRFLRMANWENWDQFIGIRADEMRRVAKIRDRGRSTESADETMCMPLADVGVTVRDVLRFWSVQPFDLELLTVNGRTLAGNCDLCFLKPTAQIASLIAERPARAVWWMSMEQAIQSSHSEMKATGAKFHKDRPSYQAMAAFAASQRDMFDPEEEAIACFCGD